MIHADNGCLCQTIAEAVDSLSHLLRHINADQINLSAIKKVQLERLLLVSPNYEVVGVTFDESRTAKGHLNGATSRHLEILDAVQFVVRVYSIIFIVLCCC